MFAQLSSLSAKDGDDGINIQYEDNTGWNSLAVGVGETKTIRLLGAVHLATTAGNECQGKAFKSKWTISADAQ